MTTLEKADAHIQDARGNIGGAIGILQTLRGLQVQNGKLREDQMVAAAHVQALLAQAHATIGLYLLQRYDYPGYLATNSDKLTTALGEQMHGQERDEEV